ncbi:MAG: methyl-accepting chemotaxis protein [Polaromonas sp.]|nr:methyl-accepting chemotaxis protein [Polaromonas sp.]
MIDSRNHSIRVRLMLAFGLLLLLGAVQGVLVMWSQQRASFAVNELTDAVVMKQQVLYKTQEQVGESARIMTQYLLLLDFPLASEFASSSQTQRREARLALDRLFETVKQSYPADQIEKIRSAQQELDAMQEKVLAHIKANKNELAVGLWVRDSTVLLSKVTKELQAAQSVFDGEYQAGVTDIKRQLLITAWVTGCTFAVSIVITILLAWLLTASIAKRVEHALAATEALAQGRLKMSSERSDQQRSRDASSRDELARLQSALALASTNLHGTIVRIGLASDAVRAASGEIAEGNETLTVRAEQQTSSLHKTGRLLEDLFAAVQRNAQAARTANDIAATAGKAAERGGQAMVQVVTRMKEIQQSSRRIADVTGVIDSIAFQTNILALNAAVEAARAGEQGRGFAVVASEVRVLAQRCSQAAREIKVLISSSAERVDGGERMVCDAGDSIQELISEVHRVSGHLSSISSSSINQESDLGQISGAMGQLEALTAEAATMVDRHARTSQGLQLQAAELNDAVSVFKLEYEQHS